MSQRLELNCIVNINVVVAVLVHTIISQFQLTKQICGKPHYISKIGVFLIGLEDQINPLTFLKHVIFYFMNNGYDIDLKDYFVMP